MKTANVFPTAHGSYRNGVASNDVAVLVGRTGTSTGNTYYAYLTFDLSAFANAVVSSLTLNIRQEQGNSVALPLGLGVCDPPTFGAVEAAGDAAASASIADADGAWSAIDVTALWASLRLGTRSIALGAVTADFNTYKVFYDEIDGSNAPYITVLYEDGAAHIFDGVAGEGYAIYIDNGTAFEAYTPYIDLGAIWKKCGG